MFKWMRKLTLLVMVLVLVGAVALPSIQPQQVEAGRGLTGVVITPTILWVPYAGGIGMARVPLAVGTVLDLLTYYPIRDNWWACLPLSGICGYVADGAVSY